MNISIIIPSYNTQDSITSTLSNLINQNTQVECEIIVVDCSEHTLVKEICTTFTSEKTKIHYIHREKRFNPGEGRNIGANYAQGDLLVFIDADVKLAENSLQAAWNHFQGGKSIFGGSLELNTENNSDLAAYVEHFFFNQ